MKNPNGSSNPVSMKDSFRLFWINYIKFIGTSSRSEYWWWILWNLIFHIPIMILLFLGIDKELGIAKHVSMLSFNIGVTVNIIIGLVMLLPNLSLETRRMRDAGTSTTIIVVLLIGAYVFALISSYIKDLDIIASISNIAILIITLLPSKKFSSN